MDSTEVTIRRFLTALPSPGYDLGILNDQGMYRLEGASPVRVLRMLSYLKYRNAHNAHIYLRPTGESAYTLLDDLTEPTIENFTRIGYGPAAVFETSPGNFQAWLRHPQPLCKELGTLASKTLAAKNDEQRRDRMAISSGGADAGRRSLPGETSRSPSLIQHANDRNLQFVCAAVLCRDGGGYRQEQGWPSRVRTSS